MCPERKVRSKPYSQECKLTVDEQEEEIKSVVCHDCPASEGGCKHAVAFLMWCHRRSEEPPCTAVECYWRKSTLSKVGSSIKVLLAKDIKMKRKASSQTTEVIPNKSVIEMFVTECKKRKINSCQLLKHEADYIAKKTNMLSLHYLMCKFNEGLDCNLFLSKISNVFNDINIKNAEKETRHQHKTAFWYELRYGRITASKCYEVSKCKTVDGSLVAAILGARTPLTSSMKRGQILEEKVRKTVEQKIGHKIEKCGLFISEEFPMIAGSPDGILHNKSTLVEIKCPISEKTFKTYIQDGAVTKKYLAQVQMQMFCAKVDESIFCVANSNFENSNNVSIIKVQYDENFVRELLDSVLTFWKTNIYPILYESTKI